MSCGDLVSQGVPRSNCSPCRRVAWSPSLVVVAVVVAVVAVGLVRRSVPADRAASSRCRGLTGPVTVLRDDQGIPQIYADNADDLFRAQGYVQAQDRFFEMDLRRHITAGRLSELVGDATRSRPTR